MKPFSVFVAHVSCIAVWFVLLVGSAAWSRLASDPPSPYLLAPLPRGTRFSASPRCPASHQVISHPYAAPGFLNGQQHRSASLAAIVLHPAWLPPPSQPAVPDLAALHVCAYRCSLQGVMAQPRYGWD
eukprot:GGOE01034745.1.p4 GENE.GGOE01034745.1~~GGOE01034745.1.p4  ORF type:complete len:128 (+),score=2.05 GGOE01034745.1:1662-2045(+)